MNRIQIWDLPTRLVHWLLVALVAFSWWSAENHEMEYHRYSGYALLGVLVFRLYWGFFGSATARFTQFVKGPRAVVAYIKSIRAPSSEPTTHSPQPKALRIGHNPLGALSVIALLLLLFTQVGLGLFAVDIDGIESGPLSYLVSFDTGRILANRHEAVFNILLGFIVLHVVAILFYYFFKRDNLIRPMITGGKIASPEAQMVSVSNGTSLSSVIPARAGIHALDTETKIDSRLRGNDGRRIKPLKRVPLVSVSAPLLRVAIGIALAAATVWLIV